MKSVCFALMTLVSANLFAGNGDDYITFNSGFVAPGTGIVQMSYERGLSYDTSVSLFGEGGKKFGTVKDYYWDLGIGYKTLLRRYKNSDLRLVGEVHGGAHLQKFFFGAGLNLEYNYVFKNGLLFFVQQKNQVNFLHNDTFKNGFTLGIKVPI